MPFPAASVAVFAFAEVQPAANDRSVHVERFVDVYAVTAVAVCTQIAHHVALAGS